MTSLPELYDAIDVQTLAGRLQPPSGSFGVFGTDQTNGAIVTYEFTWAVGDEPVLAIFETLENAAHFAQQMSKLSVEKPGPVKDILWYVRGEGLDCFFEFFRGEKRDLKYRKPGLA